MISTTKTTALVIGMFAIGGLIATNALTAAFADSNTSGDQVIKQTNKAKVYQKAKNTASQNGGISLASPITGSPNTAASNQVANVAQGNVNTGNNTGPTQTNTANCGIAAIANLLISC
jgi:hypothetical protein